MLYDQDAMANPLISVIIPVWNSAATLQRCLEALAGQTLSAACFEIIVIDNGSTDDTAKTAASFPGVKLLSEPRPGSYVARNQGIAHARGQYLAFTDADCVPAPDWLQQALDAARRHPEAGVLAGRIELFEEGESDGPAFSDYERLFSFPQSHAARGNCATANWMSPHAAFERLGGFDEHLKSGGDRQMALRIKAAGMPLAHVPQMVVGHPVRASRNSLVRKRRRLSGGRWERTGGPARLARVLWATVYDTGRRLRKAAITPGFSLRRRLAVMRLTVELSLVAALEFWRLFRGQAAARD